MNARTDVPAPEIWLCPASDSHPEPTQQTITFLVLKDGRGGVVTDYWFESGQRVRLVSVDGTSGVFSSGILDLGRTVKLNRERGVEFVIQTKEVSSSQSAERDLLSASRRGNGAAVQVNAYGSNKVAAVRGKKKAEAPGLSGCLAQISMEFSLQAAATLTLSKMLAAFAASATPKISRGVFVVASTPQ